jgi:hypothetical protein
MTSKICDKCQTRFSTNFCPSCGRKYEDIVVVIPDTFVTYIHGDKESGYGKCEEMGIESDSKLGQKIAYSGYEIKVVFEILGEEIKGVQVDVGDGQGLCDIVPIKK